ncbi:hypothetical protein GCM10010508_15040 [Streptomyces naganishii JCM 4654]|uniref:EamA domain-containing protein n=1 Tax=Streptomyces naganishii JCM 4654 TaxID=1306179 RepID=A0A918Y0U8_9ACTN|nr:hypothetical protein GCM10010508_15040 [Streptomyces naganishii JCM 4654]
MNATTSRGALLAALACVLVGGSFTANSVLGHYPYAGGQFLRYGLAWLLLLPLVARNPSARRDAAARLRRLTPRLWARVALLAAVGMVGFNLAVLAAERTAEPAVPGVLVGCAPVVVAVLVPLAQGRRPQRTVLYGALLVAAGACAVQGWGRTDGAGLAFSVCALAGEVGFAVLAVPVLRPLGPRLLATVVCGAAALEAALTGMVLDGAGWLRWPAAGEAAALLWQAAVVTVIGFVCWYMGMQRIGAERATLFSGLIPVAAACTAPLTGTGSYGTAQALGSALVCAGVATGSGTLTRPGRRPTAALNPVTFDAPARAEGRSSATIDTPARGGSRSVAAVDAPARDDGWSSAAVNAPARGERRPVATFDLPARGEGEGGCPPSTRPRGAKGGHGPPSARPHGAEGHGGCHRRMRAGHPAVGGWRVTYDHPRGASGGLWSPFDPPVRAIRSSAAAVSGPARAEGGSAAAMSAPARGHGNQWLPSAGPRGPSGRRWPQSPNPRGSAGGQRLPSRMTRATRAGSSFIGTCPQPGSRTRRA